MSEQKKHGLLNKTLGEGKLLVFCIFFVGPCLVGGFNFLYFHPYLGKISILTNIFQMG